MRARKIKYNSNLLLVILIVVGILGVVNFLSLRHFRRIDLTEGKIYSISQSTQRTLAKLTDIVNIKVYFSKELPPQLATLDGQVKDLLDEYRAYSKNKLLIEFTDPAADPSLEQRMRFIGIPKVQLNVFQKDQAQLTNVYLGLMVMYQDKKEVIPVIQDTKNLEYELTSAIIRVTQKEPKTVAFLISESEEEFNQLTSEAQEDLQKQYTVMTLDLKKEEKIPSSVNTLIVTGPEETSEKMLYEIDQFLMRGGKAIFLVDTVKMDKKNMLQAMPVRHNLDDLLKYYGVKVNNDLAMDRYSATVGFSRGFFSFRIPYPFWPKALNQNMSQDSPIVSKLSSITLPWTSTIELLTGRLKVLEAEGKVLAQTSSHGWVSKGGNYNLDPGQQFHTPSSEMKSLPLIALVSGKLKSFFENKPIPSARSIAEGGQPPTEEKTDPIMESPLTHILVAGNSRLITNSYYQPEENGAFFLNSVDWMTMGDDLIGIRSREKTDYPLKETEAHQRDTLRYLNIFGISVLFILFGLFKAYLNRKKRMDWLEN